MLPGGCPEVLLHLRDTYTRARVEPRATSALASHLWGLSCLRSKIEGFRLSLLKFFIFSSTVMNMRTFSVTKHLAFSYSCGVVLRATSNSSVVHHGQKREDGARCCPWSCRASAHACPHGAASQAVPRAWLGGIEELIS